MQLALRLLAVFFVPCSSDEFSSSLQLYPTLVSLLGGFLRSHSILYFGIYSEICNKLVFSPTQPYSPFSFVVYAYNF